MFRSNPNLFLGVFSLKHGTCVGTGSPKVVGASYPQWVSR